MGISRKRNTPVCSINGTQDHIHLLINLHPSVALATLIKEYKSYSTLWMKKNGYADFSCSKSKIEQANRYIANQKEHHKNKSFQDEINEFKKRLGIEWDV